MDDHIDQIHPDIFVNTKVNILTRLHWPPVFILALVILVSQIVFLTLTPNPCLQIHHTLKLVYVWLYKLNHKLIRLNVVIRQIFI